jgi:hypothetical protein
VEGSGGGLFIGVIRKFSGKSEENHEKLRIAGSSTEIRTRSFPYTRLKLCYQAYTGMLCGIMKHLVVNTEEAFRACFGADTVAYKHSAVHRVGQCFAIGVPRTWA